MNAQHTTALLADTIAETRGFVGSWHVTFFENDGAPTRGLATISADGTIITSEHPVVTPPVAPGPVFTSSGHGAWAATGPSTAVVTFFGLGSFADGTQFGTVAARSSICLSDDRQSFGGETIFTVADTDGNELASFPGRFEATRIVIDVPESPST